MKDTAYTLLVLCRAPAFLGLRRVLVLAGLVALFAACAPGQSPEAPAVALSPQPAASPTAALTQEAAIELTYWEEDSDDAGVLLDELAGGFMAANPGITVTRAHYGYDDLRNQFRAQAFGGTPPDVVRAPGEFAGPFGELGIVKPLDEVYSAAFLEAFLDGSLAGATAYGKLWALPDNFGNHLMLLYNRALVSSVPAATDEWIAQLKGLTDAANGRFGLVFPLEESYWLVPWLAGFGGWPLDASDMPTLDTAEMIEALWFVHDLKFAHRVVPDNADYQDAYDLFRRGSAGYIVDGAWNLERYRGLGIDVGIASLPRVSASDKLPAPMATGRYWFIASTLEGSRLEAAARFVEHMTSAEAQMAWVAKMGRLPSSKDAARSELITGDATLAGIMAQLQVARGVPPALEMICAWRGIGAYLPGVIAGEVSPDEAPPKMQAEALACVDEMGGRMTPAP